MDLGAKDHMDHVLNLVADAVAAEISDAVHDRRVDRSRHLDVHKGGRIKIERLEDIRQVVHRVILTEVELAHLRNVIGLVINNIHAAVLVVTGNADDIILGVILSEEDSDKAHFIYSNELAHL